MESRPGASQESSAACKDYIEAIAQLRSGKDLVDKDKYLDTCKPTLPIEEILERMESINATLRKISRGEVPTIEQHLKYMLDQGRKFSDDRYNVLFSTGERDKYGTAVKKREVKAGTYKKDYSSLYGYISREGGYTWDKEKIDEFISSIKRS